MRYLVIFTLFFTLISCSSTLKTSFDYDKHADFSKYKTYAYAKEAMNIPVQELNKNRLIQAIDHEMTKRGFTKSENPDVVIDLLVKTQEKQNVVTTTNGVWGYGYGYGYGPGFSTPNVDVNEYVEGTLFIIMADKQTDKMIWQGRGTKVLEVNASSKKRQSNIKKAVAAIFKNYP